MPQCDHCEDEVERTWEHPLSDERVCRECHPVMSVWSWAENSPLSFQ